MTRRLDVPPDPGRRLVIEGNKAWAAAAEVRRRWLPQLFARRAAPREVARFVAVQLLTMPEPLRLGLAAAPGSPVFTDVTGLHADQAADGCDTCPAVRLPLLMLAPIAAAYEGAMSGTEAARSTWRADRYSPCPRPDAGRYLAFLASIGYHLTVIEQAVADGVPYTGDTPAEPIPGDHDADTADGTSRDDAPAKTPLPKAVTARTAPARPAGTTTLPAEAKTPLRKAVTAWTACRPRRPDRALTRLLHPGAAGHHGRRPLRHPGPIRTRPPFVRRPPAHPSSY